MVWSEKMKLAKTTPVIFTSSMEKRPSRAVIALASLCQVGSTLTTARRTRSDRRRRRTVDHRATSCSR